MLLTEYLYVVLLHVLRSVLSVGAAPWIGWFSVLNNEWQLCRWLLETSKLLENWESADSTVFSNPKRAIRFGIEEDSL